MVKLATHGMPYIEREKMRAIKVVFLDGINRTQYSYLTDDDTIKVDDICVVKSPSGIKLVQVYQVDVDPSAATKFIVSKVDLAGYEQKTANYAEAQRLDREIKERVRTLLDASIIANLAKKDKQLSKLLDDRNSIKL